MRHLSTYRGVLLWQFAFVVFSTIWLWAPWLNPGLSAHTSAISEFEAIGQPYSTLFRLTDGLAALLLIGMAAYLTRQLRAQRKYFIIIALFIIGIGMFFDPLFPTQCIQAHSYCATVSPSPTTTVHNYESLIVYGTLLALVVYDTVKRRKLPSILTTVVQGAFGVYTAVGIASLERYATAAQFVYQFIAIIWIAWFCREMLLGRQPKQRGQLLPFIRYVVAMWVFLMGIATVLLGLTGGRFGFHPHALYLSDGAWLTQHGVIVGVMLLYISRHLLRGELRARQIVLAIFGVEIITYAVIAPHPSLLYLYFVGFAMLFVLRDSFGRGTAPLTWSIRLRDLGYLSVGLILSIGLATLVMLHRAEASRFAVTALDHFSDIVFRDTSAPLAFRRTEVLFSDTLSVFIVAAFVGIAWVLFKPSVRAKPSTSDERYSVEQILAKNSHSSEDFFKLWPHDKSYFWNETKTTFLAYRQVGAVAYVLADPIGPDTDMLLTSFQEYCQAERLKFACLPVSEGSRDTYSARHLNLLQVGASAVIDIATFSDVTARDKWWRWQRNRAEKKGYAHHVSMPPHTTPLMEQLQAISDTWLTAGNHVERGFALGYFDTEYIAKCVIHYLTDESGKAVAFVNILPSFRPLSTATIDLLRFLPDHNGTMPYLLFCVITHLKSEGKVQKFDLGFVPFASTDSRIIQIAKLIGGKRFSSKGLEQFKNKFDPTWEPNYLAYDGDIADLAQITANLEKAMKLLPR